LKAYITLFKDIGLAYQFAQDGNLGRNNLENSVCKISDTTPTVESPLLMAVGTGLAASPEVLSQFTAITNTVLHSSAIG
jgi:hypothetical protein